MLFKFVEVGKFSLRTILNRLIIPSSNAILGKFGYQIKKVEESSAVDCLMRLRKKSIREIEGLYREFVFKDLPSYDDGRINLMANLLGTEISEAIYILNYLQKSLVLPGDICEFGVAQGATSAFMAYEIRNTDKNMWLFDSFKGLSKPSKKDILIKDDLFNADSIEAYEGSMACEVEMVKQRLKDINFPSTRVKIIPGFIEKTINQSNLPDKICFAYIDFDLYEPILIALNFLDIVLQTGGFVIVDDYDYFSTGVKTAVDEFVAAHQEKYNFSLPLKSAGHFCIIEKVTQVVYKELK